MQKHKRSFPYVLILFILFLHGTSKNSWAEARKKEAYKVQLCLLFDVSGSMEGLINQAKGQIWKLVNELTKIEKNGKSVSVEIALGTFGNGRFEENGHFKLHAPLTTDLDSISEELFDISIGGSEEYCGYALKTVIEDLQWSHNKKDLRIIFIAGNESFTLGEVDYKTACKQAVKKRIIINTIFCGTKEDGIKNLWKDGAKRGKGKFLTIEQDSLIKQSETLWDDKIIDYNTRLNDTYIPYGKKGAKLMRRQILQDKNTLLLGNAIMRDRVIFKVSNSYQNPHWDLIDAYHEDSSMLHHIPIADLPINMQQMTPSERIKHIQQKSIKRELYKKAVSIYYKKADEYLTIKSNKSTSPVTLDNSIIETIIEQAKKNNFSFAPSK